MIEHRAALHALVTANLSLAVNLSGVRFLQSQNCESWHLYNIFCENSIHWMYTFVYFDCGSSSPNPCRTHQILLSIMWIFQGLVAWIEYPEICYRPYFKRNRCHCADSRSFWTVVTRNPDNMICECEHSKVQTQFQKYHDKSGFLLMSKRVSWTKAYFPEISMNMSGQ